MGIAKYNYNLDFFNCDSEELYYFLGFVAADGYINNKDIEIGLNKKDIDILIRFRDLIVPNKPLYNKESTDSYTLKISNKNIALKIKSYFQMTTNKKSNELCFPNVPSTYVKDFIRGYVDGDGCIDTTKGYYKDKIYIGARLRILSNEKFLIALNDKIKEFYKHNTNAINKKGKENVYVVTYNFSTAKNILIWLYKNSHIHLERKYEAAMCLVG